MLPRELSHYLLERILKISQELLAKEVAQPMSAVWSKAGFYLTDFYYKKKKRQRGIDQLQQVRSWL